MLPFVHFVKQTLKWDPKDRINAAEALQHPWVAHGLPD
jgi:serine/threonine protein kinase